MEDETHLSVKKIDLSEIDTQLGAGSDLAMLQTIALDDMANNLRRIRQAAERRQTQGRKFTTTLNATPKVQFWDLLQTDPYVPLATARFLNTGTAQVFLSVNDNFDFSPIWPNNDLPFDHTEADERIHYVSYYCAVGGTAVIQVVGTY